MSDMRVKKHELTIGGETYQVYFSLSTLAAVLEKYGSMDGMLKAMGIPDQATIDKIKKGEVPEKVNQLEMFRAVCFVIAALINDALEESGADGRVDERYVMRRLAPSDLAGMQDKLMQIMMDGTPKAPAQKGKKSPKNA